ncbi:MAG: hypothetical protein ACXVB0_13285 [Mucilaginibacter sp.]
MLSKSKTLFSIFLFLFFFLSQSKAQIEVLSKNALDKIKDGNTYVVVDYLKFPGAVEFLQVLKKYWTVTKGVEYLRASELKAKLKAGDSYFTMSNFFMNHTMSGTPVSSGVMGGPVNGAAGALTQYSMGSTLYFYLCLWTPTEKSLRQGREFDLKDQNVVANIYVAVHANVGERIGIPMLPFDGSGRISNWNPGTFKNFLQQLTAALQTGKKFKSEDVANKEQLKLLKDQTLYCSDENFYTTTFSYKTGKYKDAEIADLFSGYKSNYKVITSRELEDKILADTEPFFYLIHVTQTNMGTITAIVNSHTGEVIYSNHHVTFSHNLDSGDLKDIYRVVKKD